MLFIKKLELGSRNDFHNEKLNDGECFCLQVDNKDDKNKVSIEGAVILVGTSN